MKHRVNNGLRMMITVIVICVLMVSAAPRAFAGWKGTHQDAIKGVVAIMSTNDPQLNHMNSLGTGSGFGVGTAGKPTDLFVTNRHVVVDEDSNTFFQYVYVVLEDGAITNHYDEDGCFVYADAQQEKLIRCKVLYPKAGDPEYPDMAILRAESVVAERIALPLKSGFEMSAGDTVYTMGFPFSADEAMKLEQTNYGLQIKISASTDSVTVADGIISRTVTPAEFNETTVFQHTAAMNRGNSGGPLVDKDGYAVGINTYGFNLADNGVSEYRASIYVDYAMQALDELGLRYEKYGEGRAAAGFPWIAAVMGAGAAAVGLFFALKRKGKERIAYRLQSVSGPFANRRFAIEGTLRIGRDPSRNDLVVPAEEAMISGVHCMLEVKGSSLFLTDLGSKNGTYINGNRVVSGEPKELKLGDTISLANEECRFRIDCSSKKQ